ncbi:hypothetical protein RRG08_046193 [Elysia crispata]|uniref:RRM domain-containing protein n=1 Tax=Elysia crispata TaxID=231223 RepID=A0AAE1CJS2_9GAST|nr:hypothetical protein RRG08_046193 [Elysia crispata]
MYQNMSDECSHRTLYVGNLSENVTEDFLLAIFGQIGPCKCCKIIHEPGNDPYAFVEFVDGSSASAALAALNKRMVWGKTHRAMWYIKAGSNIEVEDITKNTNSVCQVRGLLVNWILISTLFEKEKGPID